MVLIIPGLFAWFRKTVCTIWGIKAKHVFFSVLNLFLFTMLCGYYLILHIYLDLLLDALPLCNAVLHTHTHTHSRTHSCSLVCIANMCASESMQLWESFMWKHLPYFLPCISYIYTSESVCYLLCSQSINLPGYIYLYFYPPLPLPPTSPPSSPCLFTILRSTQLHSFSSLLVSSLFVPFPFFPLPHDSPWPLLRTSLIQVIFNSKNNDIFNKKKIRGGRI